MNHNENATTEHHINEMIKVLEHIRRRPDSYFGGAVAPFENFINGFNVACYLFVDRSLLTAAQEDVLKSYGIERVLEKSLYATLHETDLSDEEAADAYLGVMIEAYKKIQEK